MNTYKVTVKPMSNAFAAIQRFNPDALVEFESGDESVEHYTVSSYADLYHLLDNAPGIVSWEEIADDFCDFPPDDVTPFDNTEKFHDWDCWYHPVLGFQESKRKPKPINEVSDYALTVLMDAGNPIAAAEWRRRYPNGAASRTGTKEWALGYDKKAAQLARA